MSERNFFTELKRRNVYKVAAAYAVVGWLLLQLGSILFPTFEAPSWVMKVFVALVAGGFPIALVVAWAFELTPEGIKRTDEITPSEHTQAKSHAWIYVVLVGAALSIGLFFLGRYTASNGGSASAANASKSVAVLPLANQSGDPAQEYFSDGLTEELINGLGKIAELRVIGRNSSFHFKGKTGDSRAIGQALGVAHLLEGSVQRSGDKVRVNVQLINARSDSHVWAKSYDGDAKDIFGVESQVAQQVADALRAKLSPEKVKTLAKAPTQDPDAYDLFLRAEAERRAAHAALKVEAFDRAVGLYSQALQRDPSFVLAVARMAEARLWKHWFVAPFDAAELADVRSTIDRALSIAPDLPAAHVALGTFYYYAQRDYEKALAEYRPGPSASTEQRRGVEISRLHLSASG